MTGDGLSSLEIATGVLLPDPARARTRTRNRRRRGLPEAAPMSPREALERAILPALLRPPCLVSSEPVVAVLGGDRVQGDDQVGPVSGGGQPPGAVSAGRPVLARGRRENPGPSRFPVPPVGAGPAPVLRFLGAGRAQPCPTAWPSWSVTVTHQVVLGFRAAAAARSRARAGSTGPMPGISPGLSACSSRVAAGMVRVTFPANPPGPPPVPQARAAAGAAGGPGPGGSPCPGAGRGRRGRGAGPCRPPARPPSAPAPTR